MDTPDAGKRLAKKPKKGVRVAVMVLGVLAALAATAYLSLCAFAGVGDSLLPNTTAAGIPLGGMDRAAASLRLQEELSNRMAGLTVDFLCDGRRYSVPGSAFSIRASEAVDRLSNSQRGTFLRRGIQYLQSMSQGSEDQAVDLALESVPEAVVTALNQTEDALIHGSWTTQEDTLVLTKGRTGRTVDREELLAALTDRARRLLNEGPSSDYAEIVALISESAPTDPDFELIRAMLYSPAADAYFDSEARTIVPSVIGRSLDVSKAKDALAGTAEGEQARVELDLILPETSTEDLESLLFREVIGQAHTHCTGTADRIGNVRVASELMNDTILMPGDVFSFLHTCGPYTTGKGYKKGIAYHGGKSVLSVGGGVCQSSSTLYYAALRANLEIVERHGHGYEPSYIPGGLDATVASNVLDFQFKNNTDYPIRIQSYMDERNEVYVILHGTNVTGIHGEPYSTNRTVTRYAETVYEANESIPRGTKKKDPERTAYNGVTTEAWQKLVDSEGNVIEEYMLYQQKYSCRNAVIFYNPADADLWNIDPATGRLRPQPVATPEPGQSSPPEGEQPPAPEGSGETSDPPAADPPVIDPPAADPSPSEGEPSGSEAPPAEPDVFTPPSAEE